MLRTILTTAAGTSGAYATASDTQANKLMMEIVKGTQLDPAAVDYASQGMSPLWAFATVAVVGMGPKLADTFRDFIQSKNVRAERALEAQLSGYIEKGASDEV